MKPDFALSLSFDGITLLRRASGGWLSEGEVALDSDDLDAALAELRTTAEALSPKGRNVKLVIPNEQIRYLSLPVPKPRGDVIEAIETALNGATPYAVDDLAYDWSEKAGTIFVAAVARETLDEAQGFATGHDFVPVACVAVAPKGAFSGEVFFGPASGWTGAAPERDDAAVVIVKAPVATPERAAPQPDPEPVEPVASASEAEPVSADPVSMAKPQDVAQDAAEASMSEPTTPERDSAEPDSTEQGPQPALAEPVATAPNADHAEDKAALAPGAADAAGDADSGLSPGAANAAPPVPQGALRVPQPPRSSATAASAPNIAPHTEPGPPPAFMSIRASRTGTSTAPSVRQGPRDAPPAMVGARVTPVLSATAPLDTSQADSAAEGGIPPLTAGAKSARDTLDRAASAPAEPAKPARKSGFFSRRAQPAVPSETPPLRKTPAAPLDMVPNEAAARMPEAVVADRAAPAQVRSDPKPVNTSAMARLAARRNRSSKPVPAAATETDIERERMTVFGARREATIGGKPRFLGLMLTALLLILLAGVAAWASVFLDDGLARFFRPDTSPAVNVAAADLPRPADTVSAEEEAEADAPVELAALETGLLAGDDVSAPAALAEPDAAALSPERPGALTPEEADATYAATGIWQRAPGAPLEPAQSDLGSLYVASIDPDVQQFDAIALPRAEPGGDAGFRTPPVPAPASIEFDLDARGLVRAVPEGAMNADGILIYAGLPPVVPPDRSGASVSTPEETPQSQAEQTRLEGLRPKARPGGLVERNERAELGGRSVAELARLRPAARPEVAKFAEEADITATALAVSTSRSPLPRPRDIARIVEEAQARNAARVADQVARSLEPDPEAVADGEVQVASAAAVVPRTVAPSIPSSTSVAKEATVRGALNLRQINLIGVYGKPSSRRALVRLPNGRYQKVQVGDRIDGGQVAAIGENDLRYAKSGRNVVLTMPR